MRWLHHSLKVIVMLRVLSKKTTAIRKSIRNEVWKCMRNVPTVTEFINRIGICCWPHDWIYCWSFLALTLKCWQRILRYLILVNIMNRVSILFNESQTFWYNFFIFSSSVCNGLLCCPIGSISSNSILTYDIQTYSPKSSNNQKRLKMRSYKSVMYY